MVRWLSAQGARLRVADSRTTPPGLDEVVKLVAAEQIFCGAFNDALFADVDLIAISPGVPLSDPHVAAAQARGIPVVGDIELFAQQIQDSGFRIQDSEGVAKIIAITGSNGKTTVTSLVEHLCRAAGKDAVAAGNISPAVLDVVLQRGDKQPEVWVLELSSFQLETTNSLCADAATVLNVSEDHLDRYAGMDEYAAAKERVLSGCRVQVLNRDDKRSIGMKKATGEIISFGLNLPACETDFGIERENNDVWLVHGSQRLIKAGELQLAGLHNVANALAALALCHSIGLPMPVLLAALCSFKGLPHRVERVAHIHGVTFYDDSKGTNVGATVAALEGLGCRAVLIAGGVGKEQDFSPLKLVVKEHARAVVLIGRDASLIATALAGCDVPVQLALDMNDAVRQSAKLALQGDAVLLSPACASFDMYRNYVHRADAFVEEVRKLINEHGKAVDDDVSDARFPHLNPLPQAREDANESLRELQMTRESWPL
jgi:UDP-N-acetylmuramoylalanine--D-glutamate ligase